ncbi:MAG: hypothetical protein ABI068_13455 [Ktedonobacterales bacterium]
MESDSEREQMLVKFREAQRLIDRSAARRKRRPIVPELLVIWIIIILAVGGIAAWFAVPAYLQFQVIDPVKSFCRIVSAHDDQDAYALFSSSFQSKVSFTQFSNDITTSNLTYCDTASCANFTNAYRNAQIAETFDYADSTDDTSTTASGGSFSFIFENGGWRIDSMVSSQLSMP